MKAAEVTATLFSLWDAVLITVLGAWLILSILAQESNSGLLRGKFYDFCGLLPNYRFFAPSPMTHDQQFEYRVFREDTDDALWRPLAPIPKSRCRWLFNPLQRVQKGHVDMSMMLLRTQFPPGSIYLPYPYLLVLSTAIEPLLSETEGTFQFRIVQSTGLEESEPQVVFVSYPHPLPLVPFSC